MKQPKIIQLRLPILVVLLAGEIIGFIHFYDRLLHHLPFSGIALAGFVKLCLLSDALIVPYLWSDWLLRRQIQYFEIAMVVILGPGAVLRLSNGEFFRGALDGIIFLVFLLPTLLKLFRPIGTSEGRMRAKKLSIREDKDKVPRLGPGAKLSAEYFGLLLVWLMAIDLLWSRATGPIPFWMQDTAVIVALWLLLESIVHLFKKNRGEPQAIEPIQHVD